MVVMNEGQAFPAFSLPDQNGRVVANEDFFGKKAVFYFYPKDDTPGCTAEACEFQTWVADLRAAGKDARIVGVSPDDVKSHRKFADKYGLEFTLLADSEHALCEAVGVWVEKSMYGKKYMGVERTTFVLDENGIIERVYRKVKPQGHADEVLSSIP
jgi:peroxiredoxin Q/BCP